MDAGLILLSPVHVARSSRPNPEAIGSTSANNHKGKSFMRQSQGSKYEAALQLKWTRARKTWKCHACGREINPGDYYHRQSLGLINKPPRMRLNAFCSRCANSPLAKKLTQSPSRARESQRLRRKGPGCSPKPFSHPAACRATPQVFVGVQQAGYGTSIARVISVWRWLHSAAAKASLTSASGNVCDTSLWKGSRS